MPTSTKDEAHAYSKAVGTEIRTRCRECDPLELAKAFDAVAAMNDCDDYAYATILNLVLMQAIYTPSRPACVYMLAHFPVDFLGQSPIEFELACLGLFDCLIDAYFESPPHTRATIREVLLRAVGDRNETQSEFEERLKTLRSDLARGGYTINREYADCVTVRRSNCVLWSDSPPDDDHLAPMNRNR